MLNRIEQLDITFADFFPRTKRLTKASSPVSTVLAQISQPGRRPSFMHAHIMPAAGYVTQTTWAYFYARSMLGNNIASLPTTNRRRRSFRSIAVVIIFIIYPGAIHFILLVWSSFNRVGVVVVCRCWLHGQQFSYFVGTLLTAAAHYTTHGSKSVLFVWWYFLPRQAEV